MDIKNKYYVAITLINICLIIDKRNSMMLLMSEADLAHMAPWARHHIGAPLTLPMGAPPPSLWGRLPPLYGSTPCGAPLLHMGAALYKHISVID